MAAYASPSIPSTGEIFQAAHLAAHTINIVPVCPPIFQTAHLAAYMRRDAPDSSSDSQPRTWRFILGLEAIDETCPHFPSRAHGGTPTDRACTKRDSLTSRTPGGIRRPRSCARRTRLPSRAPGNTPTPQQSARRLSHFQPHPGGRPDPGAISEPRCFPTAHMAAYALTGTWDASRTPGGIPVAAAFLATSPSQPHTWRHTNGSPNGAPAWTSQPHTWRHTNPETCGVMVASSQPRAWRHTGTILLRYTNLLSKPRM